MSSNITVVQGDSVALAYATSPAQDMTTWTCQVMVKTSKNASALITQSLTSQSPDSLSKIGLLQTTSLSPGNYFILAKLSHTASGQSKEVQSRLTVEERGVY